MDTELNRGVKNNQTQVYGRSFKEDLNSFYNNIELRNTLAVFGAFDFIQNGRHLSEITGKGVADCNDWLECLENLNMIQRTDKGFKESESKHYEKSVYEDPKSRRLAHAEKLIQVAGNYPSSHKVNDLFGVYCTNEKTFSDLTSKIRNVLNEFMEQNQQIPKEEKNMVLNFGLATTLEKINNEGGK